MVETMVDQHLTTEKIPRIRTEKIDFVLTQICDMRVYPVLIRPQLDSTMVSLPNLPLLRREIS